MELALVSIKSKKCWWQELKEILKNFILNGLGKKCKVRRDLVIHVQCITVASLSIVNVNNPRQTHPVCL